MVALCPTLDWLIVEHLTLPEVVDGLGSAAGDAVAAAVIQPILDTTPGNRPPCGRPSS